MASVISKVAMRVFLPAINLGRFFKMDCASVLHNKSKMLLPRVDNCLHIGDFRVFAWSISGIESSVVVHRNLDGFSCCFDMGHASRENVKVDKVMITHGHMDHISAIPQHIKKRELLGLKPATYFVPAHLAMPLLETCSQFAKVSEDSPCLENPKICGTKPGEKFEKPKDNTICQAGIYNIKLNKSNYAVPFLTVHRIPSQGYLVYHVLKELKPEYKDLQSMEIAVKIKNEEEVHTTMQVPEIAYTGDTTFEVFTNNVFIPPPDLFKVKLLIVEATYIDIDPAGPDRIQLARQYGHIHLSEIYENAALFKNVEHILLVHLSDKYSVEYIQQKVFENIPAELKDKIYVSTLAKECYI